MSLGVRHGGQTYWRAGTGYRSNNIKLNCYKAYILTDLGLHNVRNPVTMVP